LKSAKAATPPALSARIGYGSMMPNPPRKIAFVTLATDHGTLIVNRFDQHIISETNAYGLGYQLLEASCYDPGEVDLTLKLLDLRRQHHGDGVIVVDCGANIGVFTVEWAKHMSGWGAVLAFEAQERLYYALAGNIAINNCFNARAVHAAVSSQLGTMKIPAPNYFAPASFGSLELKKRDGTEFIGQVIDYSEEKMISVPTTTLDSYNFPRVDLIKIDVEGMELDVLAGAGNCIANGHPILLIEQAKVDRHELRAWLERFDYATFDVGMNLLALHQADKCLAHVKG
jgi:FkbM family methyltransferase